MNVQESDISLVSGALRSGDNPTDSSAKAPERTGPANQARQVVREPQVQPSRENMQQMLDEAEELFGQQGVALKFKLQEGVDQYQVEVRDKDSDRVIRKIPADEVVNLAKSIKKALASGALLDKGI